MSNASTKPTARTSGYRVREFVTTYRPLRDAKGNFVEIPIDVLTDARTAAAVLAPLIADEPVEVFGVACLNTKHRLLAWHVLSRGTRSAAPVSIPDVFVPVCLTPGTTAAVVLHNHPSGDPSPSLHDARLTARLRQAADVLDIELLDHIIVGDRHRYFSFRLAGVLGRALDIPASPHTPSHRSANSAEGLGHVKASLAPLAADAALTSAAALRSEGTYRCEGENRREEHHE